jgi:hypothetical protein
MQDAPHAFGLLDDAIIQEELLDARTEQHRGIRPGRFAGSTGRERQAERKASGYRG